MIAPLMIAIAAILTAALCFLVAYRFRGYMIAVDWRFFAAMGLGTLAIAVFYLGIARENYHGHSVLPFIPFSRILWGFIVLSTAILAFSVLNIGNGGPDGD